MYSEINKTRMLCVFTKILGGKTFSEVLERHLANIDSLECKVIDYERADYSKYPTPKFLKFSNSLDSAWRIYKKVRNELNGWQHENLFFSSYHLLPPFWFDTKKKRTFLSLDTTPALALRMGALRGNRKQKIVAEIKANISKILFKQLFKHIDVFFARTQWCANSLVNEFGVKPEKVVVTYMPVEVPEATNKKIVNDKLALLFVGNDFERKGGSFLLEMFEKHLSKSCTLTILSNSSPNNYYLTEGVNWVSNCNKNSSPSIFDYYHQADLFVFPTWNEQLGLVLCEAIAIGLPIVARDVGGVSELVVSNYNGHLQEYESGIDDWAEKILALAENRRLLESFSENSLIISKTKLGKEIFEQSIKKYF